MLVSLHPPIEGSLHPGATLAGTLDFSVQQQQQAGGGGGGGGGEGGLRCSEVLIMLETEESEAEAWRPPAKPAAAAPIRRIWDEQVEATPNATCSHFVFSVPPDATASFSTPLVAMRWLLRFQFTAVGAGGAQQQLAWTLPVVVTPPMT